jgi:predicted MFS family arabinose efflux permease
VDEAEEEWTPRRLLRAPVFLMSALVLGITIGTNAGWSAHLAPFVRDLGASTGQASLYIGSAQGIAILGTLGFGYLADRRSPTSLIAVLLAVQVACLTLFLAEPGLGWLAAGVLLFGLMGGAMMPVYSQLLAQRFGAASLGKAMGLSNLFLLPFGFGLPMIGGALRDSQGSYSGMIALCAGMLACALIVLFFCPREASASEPAAAAQ